MARAGQSPLLIQGMDRQSDRDQMDIERLDQHRSRWNARLQAGSPDIGFSGLKAASGSVEGK